MQARLVIQTPCVSGMPSYLKFLRATRYSCQPQPSRYKEVVEEGLGVILKQCRCVCAWWGSHLKVSQNLLDSPSPSFPSDAIT